VYFDPWFIRFQPAHLSFEVVALSVAAIIRPRSSRPQVNHQEGITIMLRRLALLLGLASLVSLGSLTVSAGQTLYPDLKTRPPRDLSFAQRDDVGWVLRFTNTVANVGQGPLELQGDPNTSPGEEHPIFQNFYDAAGKLTGRKQVATDTIFHPEHNHYHFADFGASVLLERKAGSTRYRATSMTGAKTSFCIEDVDEVIEGSSEQTYTECGTDLQGLTPGWSDIYASDLWGQWIVIGDEPLADGKYGLKSTVDPDNLLDEGTRKREHNNSAITYFTVTNGVIQIQNGK
jgi:hypothetical protein